MPSVDISDIEVVALGSLSSSNNPYQSLIDFGCDLDDMLTQIIGHYSWQGNDEPQAKLAKMIEEKAEEYFQSVNLYATKEQTHQLVRYSTKVNYKADVIAHLPNQTKPRIFLEVEMRPNFEKDMVKFHIGQKNSLLKIAILVVVKDRNQINPSYTSMPQFNLVKAKIEEYSPDFPILLFGLELENLSP
jgi:putative lipoic acid-binding regulatory protein